MIPWRLAHAYARRARLRGLLTVGSVALAVLLVCLTRTVTTTFDGALAGASAQRVVTSSAVGIFVGLPIAHEAKIRAVPGVRSVTHWTWFGGVYKDGRNFFGRIAADIPTMREVYGDRRRGPDGRPIPAEIVLTESEWEDLETDLQGCMVGRVLAAAHGLEIGGVVPLLGTAYPGVYRLRVRGIYRADNPAFDENTLIFHWKHLHEVAETNLVGAFVIDLDRPDLAGAVCSGIDAIFENSAHRTRSASERAFQAQWISGLGNVNLLFGTIAVTALFATFMIVLNTMLLSARERVRDFGVLRSLGFPAPILLVLYVAEALILCGVGAALGIALSFPAARAIAWEVRSVMPDFEVAPVTMVAAACIALCVGLIAGLAPGLAAARRPIISALSTRG